MTTAIIDHPAPNVARLRINRPENRNALDHATRQALIDGLRSIYADTNNRALVFGGVDGVLSAGGDVPSMVGLSEMQARERMQHGRELSNLFEQAKIPVVTAVERMGVGNCMGLAMLGDYIVMGEDAFIMFPFLKLGLIPDWGILRSLPRRVGLPAARRVLMSCERIPAKQALNMSLVDSLAEKERVMMEAISIAEQFAQLPISAFAKMKERLNYIAFTLDEELATEEAGQAACLLGEEFQEGYEALTNKRAANFVCPSTNTPYKNNVD